MAAKAAEENEQKKNEKGERETLTVTFTVWTKKEETHTTVLQFNSVSRSSSPKVVAFLEYG